ncbi:MAG: L-ribulokinase [Solirubrobacteraceae bacterium]|nr:L-ribulokinase [Solirubrobacteraceae bacterium]
MCTIGVDFGTESGRVLLLGARTGEPLAVNVVPYASAVIDRELPGTGETLPTDWALQDPADWVTVLERGVPTVLRETGVDPADVVGLGVDFTSCTVLPVDAGGVPLCQHERWRARRHAWPKLWKHHAAQPVADRLNLIADERGEAFLSRYGGRISSEWYFPKLIEIWLEDRELYESCAAFVEATDWIVWHLTGHERRQRCTAAYKAMWSEQDGLPSPAYFEAAYPGFAHPAAKLGHEFLALGARAGGMVPERARALGLSESTAVAVGNVDSFVSVPGAGVSGPETFVTVIGTSICDMVLGTEEVRLPGITGVAYEGILPGLYGYEAGQVAVGDMLAWYVRTLGHGPEAYSQLEAQAGRYGPGETGLLALDWWNGNRSILADADLTGVLVGLTLHSRPEEVYRALLESIAYGNRRIMDNFTEHGVPLCQIVACGGIAERSPLTMQLIADISGRPVYVPGSREIPARGSALFGAVAAGVYPGIEAAVEATREPSAQTYRPDPTASRVYDRVYAVYRQLYETLGRSQVQLLHELKRIRTHDCTPNRPKESP